MHIILTIEWSFNLLDKIRLAIIVCCLFPAIWKTTTCLNPGLNRW